MVIAADCVYCNYHLFSDHLFICVPHLHRLVDTKLLVVDRFHMLGLMLCALLKLLATLMCFFRIPTTNKGLPIDFHYLFCHIIFKMNRRVRGEDDE